MQLNTTAALRKSATPPSIVRKPLNQPRRRARTPHFHTIFGKKCCIILQYIIVSLAAPLMGQLLRSKSKGASHCFLVGDLRCAPHGNQSNSGPTLEVDTANSPLHQPIVRPKAPFTVRQVGIPLLPHPMKYLELRNEEASPNRHGPAPPRNINTLNDIQHQAQRPARNADNPKPPALENAGEVFLRRFPHPRTMPFAA